MIKLLIDSSADLNKNDCYFATLIPIGVTIGENTYLDGIDLEKDEFYKIITTTKARPLTSQPSQQDFIEEFSKIKENGDEAIYFALSSQMSGTYKSATMAKEAVGYDKIHIIDSKLATSPLMLLVKHANKMLKQGCSAQQIVKECEQLKSRIKIIAGLDTLENLRRGGRLSNASAIVGSLLNIKPIVTINEKGAVESIGKGLGVTKTINLIIQKFQQYQLDENFPVYSAYTYGTGNAEKFEAKLAEIGIATQDRLQIGPTVGTHLGPQVYGVVFVTK